jgi:hypothetical protein
VPLIKGARPFSRGEDNLHVLDMNPLDGGEPRWRPVLKVHKEAQQHRADCLAWQDFAAMVEADEEDAQQLTEKVMQTIADGQSKANEASRWVATPTLVHLLTRCVC